MSQRRRVPWRGEEDTFIHNQSRKQSRKGNAIFRAPGKRTLLLPGSKASSESPDFSDLRDPGAAKHSSCWPPSWPWGRRSGGRNSHISRRPHHARGDRGRRPKEGCHVAAPGGPATRGRRQGSSWPLQGAGPPGRRCPSTGQQIPPGWQDGASSSAQGGCSEGWDGVSQRGGIGKHGAGHSS